MSSSVLEHNDVAKWVPWLLKKESRKIKMLIEYIEKDSMWQVNCGDY